MLKGASLSPSFSVLEGENTFKSVSLSQSAAIPWPIGSLDFFTFRSFRVAKAFPVIVVPIFVYVVYPGRLPKLGWVTSWSNRMSRAWLFRKSRSMAILVGVYIPFRWSVAILSVFMGGAPTLLSTFSQGCVFVYASVPVFVLLVFQVLFS